MELCPKFFKISWVWSQQIHSELKRCKSLFYLCSSCDLSTVSRDSWGSILSVTFIIEKKERGFYIIVKVAPLTKHYLHITAELPNHRIMGMVGREHSGVLQIWACEKHQIWPQPWNKIYWARETTGIKLISEIICTIKKHKYFLIHTRNWKCHYSKNYYKLLNIGANFHNNQTLV